MVHLIIPILTPQYIVHLRYVTVTFFHDRKAHGMPIIVLPFITLKCGRQTLAL